MFKSLINEKNLNFLNENKSEIAEINSCDPETKLKILKNISKMDFPHDDKYSELYSMLADIDDLWYLYTEYGIPLLSFLCYNYHDSYHNCLLKLTNKENIWYFKNKPHNYTALSFLIVSLRDYKREETLDIIQNLTKYPKLWLEKDTQDNTPLHDICLYKKINIIHTINKFTDEKYWKTQNRKNMTPLHNLCLNYDLKNKELVDFIFILAQYKNLWIVKDEFGYTPLHLITRYMYGDENYRNFFAIFENQPEFWNITNNSNKTPKDLYIENSSKEYVVL
jgi:hypothetical protein